MKKPFLLLFVSTLLTGSVLGQALPVKKKKPAPKPTTEAAATATKADPAAPAAVPVSEANPALPATFDPKIVTDTRATDGQKPKPAGPVAAPNDKNAKNLKPSNDAYEIGKTQLEQGDEKEAMIYFDKAIKLYPNNFQAVALRGKAKVLRKMYPEAVVDLNRAAKGMPEDAEVYFWRGRAKQEQDKDKEAVADFTKAIGFKADMADAYYWRGHSYSEMDMLRESACPDFAKASELGSELGTKASKKYCSK